MKRGIRNLFLLPVLIAGLGLILAGRVTAQTFINLHSFNGSNGASPYAELIVSGNTLYGTTKDGGSAGAGTVFKVNTNGSAFTNLYQFTGGNDGANPYAGLVFSGNALYGTAPNGGSASHGTIFSVNTDGTGFTNLHTFTFTSGGNATNSDGVRPFGGLILSGNTLYGTASSGGTAGWGTVFAVSTNGTGFTNLHNFTFTGSDGAYPFAGLVLAGNTLYGTTLYGGSGGNGSVFKLNTDGAGYANLYSFTNGNDGANPSAVLVLLSNALYGTARLGGSFHCGTVFAVNTDGTGFTNLHSFTGGFGIANSFAGVVLSDNALVGAAYLGGAGNKGTVFKINTDGLGFTNLYSFAGGADGANPYAAVMVAGNTAYGTASAGGSSSNGTVFTLSLPGPQLTIISSGANVILTWPANAAGFALQSTTNLVSPAVWSAVSPGAVVINGQNAVTNPVSGTQEFFRLNQ